MKKYHFFKVEIYKKTKTKKQTSSVLVVFKNVKYVLYVLFRKLKIFLLPATIILH